MKKISITLVVIILIVASCTKDSMPSFVELDNQLTNLITASSPTKEMEYYILPESDEYDKIPHDPLNILTEQKVALGKMLFHETGLGLDAAKPSSLGTFSCASCHITSAGMKPGNFQGIADGGVGFGLNGENRTRNTEYQENELDVQSARPLSLINTAYVTNSMWNGSFGPKGVNVGTEALWVGKGLELNNLGYEALEAQNIDGLETHRLRTDKATFDLYGYTPLFDEVFPEFAEEERYTRTTASFAITAYLRSILSNQAPFQQWLKGNKNALDYDTKQGGILFFGKANCSKCHYEKNLGSHEFHALGVNDMYQQPSYNTAPTDLRNFGRGGFTQVEEDYFKFRVPGIYNAGDSKFFFHGASANTLDDLIDYKNKAVGENFNVPISQISKKFKPLNLTEEEKKQLKKFLEYGLRDPNMERYNPESVLSGKCFPNADPESMMDLGCN